MKMYPFPRFYCTIIIFFPMISMGIRYVVLPAYVIQSQSIICNGEKYFKPRKKKILESRTSSENKRRKHYCRSEIIRTITMDSNSCDLTEDKSMVIQLTVMVLVEGCGILLTLSSLCLLSCINSIDHSLRDILLSLQVANLVGGGVVIHDTLITLCKDVDNLELTSVSVLLTVGHITKLLVAEHTILASSIKKGSTERFGGLIFICWLLSATVGFLNSSLPKSKERRASNVIMSLGFFASFFTVSFIYIKYIKKNHWMRKHLIAIRRVQLDEKHRKHVSTNQYGELKYVPLIYIWYFIFTFPWITQALYEGVSGHRAPNHIRFATLLIFTFCFYFPACIPFHMWKLTRSRKIGPNAEEEPNSPDGFTYLTSILQGDMNRSTPISSIQRDDKSIFNYSYAHS